MGTVLFVSPTALDLFVLRGRFEASLLPLDSGGRAFFFSPKAGVFPPVTFSICYLKYWFYNRIKSLSLIRP